MWFSWKWHKKSFKVEENYNNIYSIEIFDQILTSLMPTWFVVFLREFRNENNETAAKNSVSR